jgi:hypothetical protein
MSKLVVPRDLSCFATCGRGRSRLEHIQSAPQAPAVGCWSISEVWQTCAECCDLNKAQVVTRMSTGSVSKQEPR